MITFFISILILIVGYFTYGAFVEKVFGPTDAPTPATTEADGIDYVPMSTAKVFLIQLLNIAGLGPIFGALAGAVWGPSVFLWIVFGTIFAGAVHDYMTGMISIRHKGASVSELTGIYLGNTMKNVMRVFSVVLLILVGTVFATGPAALIAQLIGLKDSTIMGIGSVTVILILILIYYFLATLLPIDKIIGKLYPIFGIALIIMCLGVGGGILFHGYTIPELTLENLHPKGTPIWPFMFITVACGAISGFHATQSPMMARCTKSERDARKIFYGAMVTEGIIALIWAAAGAAFYGSTGGLLTALGSLKPNGVVYEICFTLLGPVGAALAMFGVVACPITSGDTAFRSARLTIADWLKIDQKKSKNRLLLTFPLLAIGALLSQMDFNIIWRYFSWSNQTLAMIVLWAATAYLMIHKKNHYLTLVPAVFMTGVTSTYILMAPEGFKLPQTLSYGLGIGFSIVCLVAFILYTKKPNFGKNIEVL